MAFEDKKGIVVASPFKLQAEALLDVRQQVDTIAERDRLVTLKAATAGLRVFVKENSTSYVYNGSSWDPLTTGAPYKHPTGDGNHHVPATGTTNSGKFLKSGTTAGSEAWSKITASDITGLPTKLPNPKAIIFTGAATGSYDGSSELTVNIPTSGTTDSALTIQMNGGTVEGTNKFTFNGSAAKNVNITPANIGAAASTHSHNYAGSGSAGGAANSAAKLATARTINGVSFDGTINIEIPNNYTKALTAEDLNIVLDLGEYYAAGGNTVKNKPSGVQHFGMKVYKTASGYIAQKLHGSDNVIYYRVHDNTSFGAWQKIYSTAAKPTAAEIGAALASHTHPVSQITGLPTKLPNPQPLKFTGAATATYDGSGAVTVDIPTAQASPFALTVQLNGGTSEGTNKFTFNGGSAKTINITPVSIGAALAVHTHTAGQITGLPTSLKNPHALTIKTNGTTAVTYDGSVVKEVNITAASIGAATSSHSHNAFKGATASVAGGTGFVPAPAIGEQEKYLRGDGTWQPISLTLAALGITASATELNYMKGVTSSVQTQLNGKALSSHTHNYAGSSSEGGPANSAKKVDFPVGTVLWTTSSSASFFSSTCGGTWEVMGNIDAIVNTSTTITLYMHKKTAL